MLIDNIGVAYAWNWEIDWLFNIFQNMHGNDIINNIMYFFTTLGDSGLIWIVISVILLFFKKTRKCGFVTLCSLLFVTLIGNNLILKFSAHRARPFYDVTVSAFGHKMVYIQNWVVNFFEGRGFLGIGNIPDGFSFASGHTVSSFVAATTIFMFYKKSGIVAFVLATIIGFSRMFFGVHWPTDVLVGIILGVGGGIGMFYLFNYLDKKFGLKIKEIYYNKIKKGN